MGIVSLQLQFQCCLDAATQCVTAHPPELAHSRSDLATDAEGDLDACFASSSVCGAGGGR